MQGPLRFNHFLLGLRVKHITDYYESKQMFRAIQPTPSCLTHMVTPSLINAAALAQEL